MLKSFLLVACLIAPAFAQPDRTVVTVNGAPIMESELFKKLWAAYGPQTLDGMINDLLIRQEVQAKKIKVSQKEIADRFALMRYDQFRSTAAKSGGPPELAPALKEEIASGLAVEKLLIKDLGIAVTDAEIQEAFDAHKDELEVPETIHLRAIAVVDENSAKKLADEIRRGADFSFLARKDSLDPAAAENGGDWGFVSTSELAPSMAQIVFLMKTGDIRVEQGPRNWYVFEVLEKRPPVAARFGEVKERLRRILIQRKINDAMPQYLAQLRAKAEIVPQGP